MNKRWLKIAYNLSGLLLFVCGLSFLEHRWYFSLVGMVFTLMGMGILGISFSVFYMNKEIKIHHPTVLKLAASGIVLSALFQAYQTRWELSIILLAIGSFVFYCQTSIKDKKWAAKKSAS